MTKHRAVVAGWDPAHVNPDTSVGRPKGVQTAIDNRIAATYDVLAEGIFAKSGVPAITGSPTNSATISPFQAAIAAPNGGFYIVSIDANEAFTITMANVGAVKIYVQQQDYQVDNTKVDSEVVIGVVYGATPIPAGALLLFTTTIVAQTSTNGLTFTPAFKYTGSASGVIRVPTQADLANVAVLQTGIRALVLTTGGGGTRSEYFYGADAAWHETTFSNPSLESLLATGWRPVTDTWTYSAFNASTRVGTFTIPTDGRTKYAEGGKIQITQATGGTKWGFIVEVNATTMKVFFGPSYTLNNETVSSPYYSGEFSPVGYKGPQLQKESYSLDGSNSQRWVYRQHGWNQVLGNNTSVVPDSVTLPVEYAGPPTVIATTLGFKNTPAATTITDFNSGAGFYVVCTPVGNNSLSANVLNRDAAATLGSSAYCGWAWETIGPVI